MHAANGTITRSEIIHAYNTFTHTHTTKRANLDAATLEDTLTPPLLSPAAPPDPSRKSLHTRRWTG